MNVDQSWKHLQEERGGRDILPRSRASTSGATNLTQTNVLASSCVVGAREVLIRDVVREHTERYVRTSISQSERDYPILWETDAPRLRSAGRSDSNRASQFIGTKADLAISATSASTAARSCPQPSRSASTSGDALRGRRLLVLKSNIHEENWKLQNLSEGGPVKGALQPTDLCTSHFKQY